MGGESNEESQCFIMDICVLPSGQVLVADSYNNNVKLLNQQYQVVCHCSVSREPRGICQITPSEVGVTVGSDVQFIRVYNSQLVTDRKLRLQHECRGISNHQGDMFITSGTALYKHSLRGKLVSKLHKDKSANFTVRSCAVSPTGDKLYITNSSLNKLLTLARDGSVLSTFTHPELKWPINIHVTPAGQVLVCCHESNIILQVDSKSSRKLATLATERGIIFRGGAWSVCYNSNTDSIIVGLDDDNKVLVYKVK